MNSFLLRFEILYRKHGVSFEIRLIIISDVVKILFIFVFVHHIRSFKHIDYELLDFLLIIYAQTVIMLYLLRISLYLCVSTVFLNKPPFDRLEPFGAAISSNINDN
jgi:hypothetical protein